MADNLCLLTTFVSDSVIEVASGEYGDLNPVLFEAVRGEMCTLNEKKNQADNNHPIRPISPCNKLPHGA